MRKAKENWCIFRVITRTLKLKFKS